MQSIQLVDLQQQYLHLKPQIDSAVESVMLSGAFINGPEVEAFSKNLANYTGSNFVTPCGNGTDALLIALMALDLPQGSEVITPAFSYAAVAEVLLLLQLKPIFADVDSTTYLIDVESVASLITDKTSALVPVHLYGQCSNMEALLDLAKTHNLKVVEDNAQAIGAQYTQRNGITKHAGTMADIGTTSFFPTKNLGCFGDGGALFTQNAELAEKIKKIANHGQTKKYVHELVGLNSRLDTIQAAILNIKLQQLNAYTAKRQEIAEMYDEQLNGLADVQIPSRVKNTTHVFHQYTLKLKNSILRDGLSEYLAEKQIPSMVYYPQPLYKQQAYLQNINLPVTQDLCNRVLSLPIHTALEPQTIKYITNTIKEYLKS